MPRRKLIRQNQFPYHVTIRSNNKDWFKIPIYHMWELCFECLQYANDNIPVSLHCFVLMNNHYHLLLTTPDCNIEKFMEYFNRRLSKKIREHSGAENHKFANRYSWTIIDSESYLYNVYRYIYQNPVRSNLCKLCIDYPYSSLRFAPVQKMILKMTVHLDYFEYRNWMDQRQGSSHEDEIRNALKKERFTISPRASRLVRDNLKNNILSV